MSMSSEPVHSSKSPEAKGGLPDWLPWAVMMALMALGMAGGFGLIQPPRTLLASTAHASEEPATPAKTVAAVAKPQAEPAPSAPAGAAPGPSVRPPGVPEVVEVRQILVQHAKSWKKADGVTRTKEEAEQRCGEALAKLQKGEPWEKVLDEYSDNPSTKKNGGSIGPVTWEQATWLIKEPIFKLKVGERSPVTPSPFGFHIYQRTK